MTYVTLVADRVAMTLKEKMEALKRTPLFGELQSIELTALAERAVVKQYLRGEIVFMAGDESQGLFAIVKGSVRALRISSDGREQVIHTEQAGATIAELPVFDDGPYPSTVVTDEDSCLLFLNKQDVRKLCLEHPEIALRALKVLSRRLRQCAELIEFLSLREVGQRLARLLVLEAKAKGKNLDSGWKVELGLTNQQIAARVGSVREVVSRALTRLQQEKLVEVKGRTYFIPNLETLSAYADLGS